MKRGVIPESATWDHGLLFHRYFFIEVVLTIILLSLLSNQSAEQISNEKMYDYRRNPTHGSLFLGLDIL